MTIKQIKEEIRRDNWYRQEAAAKIFYISTPWYGCQDLRINNRKFRQNRFKIYLFHKNNQLIPYFSKKSSQRISQYYYGKQTKNKNFLENLYKNWQKNNVKPFLNIVKEINELDLSKLEERKFLKMYNLFNKKFYAVWRESFFLDGFDYYGDILTKELFEKEKKDIKLTDFQWLLFSSYKSFLQKERLSLLSITENVIKRGIANYILKNGYENVINKYKFIKEDLEKHALEYYWINNDYAEIEYLNEKYFYKNIKELLKDRNKLQREREFKKDIGTVKVKKENISKKYKLSSYFVNSVNFLSLMTTFRDDRKACNQIGCGILNKFAKEISQRLTIRLSDIENLYTWEVKDIFRNKTKLLKQAKKRRSASFFIMKGIEKNIEFNGSIAERLNIIIRNKVLKENELKGRTAYAGRVKGIVRVVMNKGDFSKMKKGNILVAPNTRPEYVPIMKKAKAIISDEGGVTCHSAIVSRELKIPCIVGTQKACLVLKDGDRVEVDADQGLIKKIN